MNAQPLPRPRHRRLVAHPAARERAGVAVLTLNRPETRNSLSEAMLDALGDALTAIAATRRVRAVVLAANGPAFCAGHDLKELTAPPQPTPTAAAPISSTS